MYLQQNVLGMSKYILSKILENWYFVIFCTIKDTGFNLREKMTILLTNGLGRQNSTQLFAIDVQIISLTLVIVFYIEIDESDFKAANFRTGADDDKATIHIWRIIWRMIWAVDGKFFQSITLIASSWRWSKCIWCCRKGKKNVYCTNNWTKVLWLYS